MEPSGPSRLNGFGQPVGPDVPGWTPRERPVDTPMAGRLCRLERWDSSQHLQGLFDAAAADDGRMWSYLPWGPFAAPADLQAVIDETADRFQRFAILDGAGATVGSASYMRHDLPAGSVEVGAVIFTPRLQRTAAATEAMYLMMRRAFDQAGYRRYEWKCDALNARSWAAALRLGFRFEGIFRQAQVNRGRNRDTAWFSIIDSEWPALSRAFERWLAPGNFDADGAQRVKLRELIQAERA
jgi:RimJ/RimL family protein N-acetyltransferase